MIIWINGAFGVGKTTTARALVDRDRRLRLFDPEWVGYMLANNLADQSFSDFQQLPSWRRLVPVVANEIADVTGQVLVCVQTVLEQSYWREVRDGLIGAGHDVVHVVLDAAPAVTEARINGDSTEAGARKWRLEHLDVYRQQRSWLAQQADLLIDTTALQPTAVAQQILDETDHGLRQAGSGPL